MENRHTDAAAARLITEARFTPTNDVLTRLNLHDKSTYALAVDGTQIAQITTNFWDETLKESAGVGFLLRTTRADFHDHETVPW